MQLSTHQCTAIVGFTFTFTTDSTQQQKLKSMNPFTIQWNWEFIPLQLKDLAVCPLWFGDGYVDQDIYNIV